MERQKVQQTQQSLPPPPPINKPKPSAKKPLKKLNPNKQIIIGSAHNQIEIRKKIQQGCKIIFLSPLFKTYKLKYLGITRFNLIKMSFKKNLLLSEELI